MGKKVAIRRQRTPVHSLIGLAQHSLVEHSLCPLDARVAMQPGMQHKVDYKFSDIHRNRRTAKANVNSAFGLAPNDELYLHGLLSLTFSQPDSSIDFYATPHWCLKQLGIVDKNNTQGGRYDQFRQALKRLSGVTYSNNQFYDPVTGENRDVSFGFLKYSLPIDSSSRAWHFVWDPQFFRYCETIRGSFQFDFALYKELDAASRRLFLLLNKIFYRNAVTPFFNMRSLAVNSLGFGSRLESKSIKQKLLRVVDKLLKHEVIRLPIGFESPKELFHKKAKGVYSVQFFKGDYFRTESRCKSLEIESPLLGPLESLGFNNASIRRILKCYSRKMIQEWIDITQAAVERKIIKESPQAYFSHYIKEAKEKRSTPPDWWRELRKKEYLLENKTHSIQREEKIEEQFRSYLENEGKRFFDQSVQSFFSQLKSCGQDDASAKHNAERQARIVARKQFNNSSAPTSSGSMSSVGDIIASRKH